MGRNFKHFSAGINLVPTLGTNPATSAGDISVSNIDGKAYFYNGSASSSSPMVTENHIATLTNKTINGNSNTLLNISSSALSSDVLTTVNTKTVTNKTIDAASNTINNIADANISSSASIARTKLGTGTVNQVVINDGSGNFSSEAQLALTRGGTGQASASAAFNALAPTTTKGDVIVSTGSSNVRQGIGSDGTILTADASQTNGLRWATPTSAPNSSNFQTNLGLSASVNTNALTIALKDSSSANPSGASVVNIGFRNSAAINGTYNFRSVSSSLSIIAASASTIGTANAAESLMYVYAIDNAGVVELAVSLSLFDEGTLQNTTAISGGSSATTLYSTTARTAVPIRLIGRVRSTQTVAGTWATNPSEVSILPFKANLTPTIQKFTSTGTTTGYVFTISTSTTCAVGDTYTNNSNTYTVLAALTAQSGQSLFCSGASAPLASGTLTRSAGSGTSSITFTLATTLATYTTPANCRWIRSRIVGGGAGGGGGGTSSGGNGTSGTATFFGALLLVANGGGGSSGNIVGGPGGTATIFTPAVGIALTGSSGGGSAASTAGGCGGNSPFSGAGGGGFTTSVGTAAAANSGSGGGGAGGTNTGGGGGAAGYIDAIIPTPSSSYVYCVGANGAGGSAGSVAGGAGGTGVIIVEEHYQ